MCREVTDPTHLCRMGVELVSDVSRWCRIRQIGAGLVAEGGRVGGGAVWDWCGVCRVVSASVGQCRLV